MTHLLARVKRIFGNWADWILTDIGPKLGVAVFIACLLAAGAVFGWQKWQRGEHSPLNTDDSLWIASGMPPVYLMRLAEVLPPAPVDENGYGVVAFVAFDRNGKAHILIARSPKDADGNVGADVDRIEFYEVTMTSQFAQNPQLVGEHTGRLFWYSRERECWQEIGYKHFPEANEADCVGQ